MTFSSNNFCLLAARCQVVAPVSGSVSNTGFISSGESVRYQCNTGFELVGQATANCTAQASLTEVPICQGWFYNSYIVYVTAWFRTRCVL